MYNILKQTHKNQPKINEMSIQIIETTTTATLLNQFYFNYLPQYKSCVVVIVIAFKLRHNNILFIFSKYTTHKNHVMPFFLFFLRSFHSFIQCVSRISFNVVVVVVVCIISTLLLLDYSHVFGTQTSINLSDDIKK